MSLELDESILETATEADKTRETIRISPEKLLSLITIVIAVISNAVALFIKFYSFREITGKNPDSVFDFLKYFNEFVQIMVLVLIYFYLSLIRFPHEVNTIRIQKYIQRLFRSPVKLHGNPKMPNGVQLEYLGRLNLRVFNNNWRWAWASMIILYMLLLFTDTPVVFSGETPDSAKMVIEILLHSIAIFVNALGGLFLLTCYFIMLSPIRKIAQKDVEGWVRKLRRKTMFFLLLIIVGTAAYTVLQFCCLHKMKMQISSSLKTYDDFMDSDTMYSSHLNEKRIERLCDVLEKLPKGPVDSFQEILPVVSESTDTPLLNRIKAKLNGLKTGKYPTCAEITGFDLNLIDSVSTGITKRNRLNPVYEMLDSNNLSDMEADAPLMLDTFLRRHDLHVLPPGKSVLTDSCLMGRRLNDESIRYFCQANYYFIKKKNDEWSDLLSGIFNCMAIALFVSRIDSKLVHIQSWMIAILYAYAAIQPLFAYFPDGSPFIVNFVLYAALALKVQFFIIVANAVSEHRLTDLFLFTPYVKKMRASIWAEQTKTDWHVSRIRDAVYAAYVFVFDKLYRLFTLRFIYDEHEEVNDMMHKMNFYIKVERAKANQASISLQKQPQGRPGNSSTDDTDFKKDQDIIEDYLF